MYPCLSCGSRPFDGRGEACPDCLGGIASCCDGAGAGEDVSRETWQPIGPVVRRIVEDVMRDRDGMMREVGR